MNENVRKVFDMLGVEPNERFKIKEKDDALYYITPSLDGYLQDFDTRGDFYLDWILKDLIKNPSLIIKLPKKKKLRDLTHKEYFNWKDNNCKFESDCSKCVFRNVSCERFENNCWVNHKDMYSDKFLDQEIEVEE